MLCCLIHLIVCNSYVIRVGCTFSFEMIWIELKFESKDSLLAWVWHSIELILWSLACYESAIYGHIDRYVLLSLSCSGFALMLFYRCAFSLPFNMSDSWCRHLKGKVPFYTVECSLSQNVFILYFLLKTL
jgi:hypothetical protein